jgi:hypothetical protein
MTTREELLELAPDPDHGRLTQLPAAVGVWKIGTFIADPDAGSGIVWHDLTEPVSEWRWKRGSNDPRGRYAATTPTLLLWAEDDSLATWNTDTSPRFGVHVDLDSGALMRGAVFRVVDDETVEWFTVWTGRVRYWGDAQDADGQVRFHQVHLRDFMTELVDAPIGAQVEEGWRPRLDDQLGAAVWAFGVDVYGAETEDDGGGAVPTVTLYDAPEADSAHAALNLTLDSAGLVWRTRPNGRLIVHPPPWDTFHAGKFADGGLAVTGTEWVPPILSRYPNGVVFSHLPVEEQAEVGFFLEVDGDSFGVAANADGVLNELLVNYSDGAGGTTPYAYDSAVSSGKHGRRPLPTRTWLAMEAAAVEEIVQSIVDSQAFTSRESGAIHTSIDAEGAFPAIALLDQFDPVSVITSSAPGRPVLTVEGTCRSIEHVVTFPDDGIIDWQATVLQDIDTFDVTAALLPVEDLAVTDNDEIYTEFGWTNPMQTIEPTETQVRIIQQSTQWLPIAYPTTGFAWFGGLLPDTTYTFEVRLIRRVDDIVTNASPARSVTFTTPVATTPTVPPGGDGSVVVLPDTDPGCVSEWRLQESDDGGETWTTVRSGDEDDLVWSDVYDAFVIDNSDYTFLDFHEYRHCVRTDCGDGFSDWSCDVAGEFDPNCATPAALIVAPFDDASLKVFVPKRCGVEILEAVSGVPGIQGPAWGGWTLNDDVDAWAVLSQPATNGIVAYGPAAIDALTGDASTGITVNLGTVPAVAEIIKLWQCAGIHIEAIRASSTTWTPRAKFFTAGGGSTTISGDPLNLDTEYTILVSHDVEAETGTLYVDGDEVAQTTTTGERINALPVWVMALPADSYATSAAVWDSVIVFAPTVLVTDDFNRADSTTDPGTPVGTISSGWDEESLGGSGGAWGISGNELYQATNRGGSGTRTHGVSVTVPATSVDISVDITAAQSGNVVTAGLYFRQATFNNYFRLVINRSSGGALGWFLQKCISGSFTTLASGTPGAATGTLRVTDDGSEITAYINGAQVAQVTDTALNTNAEQGICVSYVSTSGANSGTGWRFDNFIMTEFP